MNILVTGGAGFIGSHLVDSLIEEGHQVIVYDNLEPDVHEGRQAPPDYLNKKAVFIKGDVRNSRTLKKALKGVEIIFHLAAELGVEKSLNEISEFVSVNTLGTACLLNILGQIKHNVKKLIVASSVSVYGEGKYSCKNHGVILPEPRKEKQLSAHQWEVLCPICNQKMKPLPISEKIPLNPLSIYAMNKRDQEEMCLLIGKKLNLPTVALRYFNVYGPRQSLSNPYSGVITLFLDKLLRGKSPVIFEDGLQSRDFVHVKDVVQANLLAMYNNKSNFQIFNIATGKRSSINKITDLLITNMKPKINPVVSNKYRQGDIRHCFADISKITETLGYEPKIDLNTGIIGLIEKTTNQKAA